MSEHLVRAAAAFPAWLWKGVGLSEHGPRFAFCSIHAVRVESPVRAVSFDLLGL